MADGGDDLGCLLINAMTRDGYYLLCCNIMVAKNA